MNPFFRCPACNKMHVQHFSRTSLWFECKCGTRLWNDGRGVAR